MYLNDHISLDYLIPLPLFNSIPQIDPSLSSMAKQIVGTESFFPNFVILFLVLHYVTGLSPQALMLLPLGLLFLPISYFAVIKSYVIVKNRYDFVLQVLLLIYVMLFVSNSKLLISFYIAPATFSLILIGFLCIKKFYENDNIFQHLIICICLISLAHYWHSALMLLFIYIASVCAISSISYVLTAKRNFFSKSISLFAISSVISLTFTHLWQSDYIGNFFRTADLLEFISNALIKLMGGIPYSVPYVFNYKDMFWGKMYFNSLLLIYIISTFIMILSIINHILIFKNNIKRNGVELHLIFSLSIISAQIVYSLLYYKASSTNFIYIPLFFAILGVSLFIVSDKNKFKKVMFFSLISLCLFTLLSTISLSLSNEAGATSVTKYDDTKNSFEWLYDNMNRDQIIIADFNILGKYLQREAQISKPIIELKYLSPYAYGFLVGDSEISLDLSRNYAVVDHATMSKGIPIHSYSSRALLEPKWIQINNCQNQYKIYEDSHVSIFIFK